MKVPPLYLSGLVRTRDCWGSTEKGKIFPGCYETEIIASGINLMHVQKKKIKNQGNIWIRATKQGNFKGRGTQEFLGLNLISSLFSFKAEMYQIGLPCTTQEFFFLLLYLYMYIYIFFFISHSRTAKIVPGQLQPQLLLDQCPAEESRNSGLQSAKPLTKLIKAWT